MASADSGYASITSYNIEWDGGSSGATWTELQGQSTESLSLTQTKTGITASSSYQFRYRAKNVFGYGPYSDVATIKGIAVPDQMSIPTVTNDAANVKIVWQEPTSNGSPISEYQILIKQKDGTWTEETTNCNGA